MTKQTAYLDRKEQSVYLREKHGVDVAPSTLACKATRGGGPLFVKFGNRALSTPQWLDEWVDNEMSAPRRHTSEDASA